MPRKRWMRSVIKAAAETAASRLAMPWERGPRRKGGVLRRKASVKAKLAGT